MADPPNNSSQSVLAGGDLLSLAAQADGSLRVAGLTPQGMQITPVAVPALTNIRALAAGRGFYLALSNGGAWSAGQNLFGQLGDGSSAMRSTPARVPGLDRVRALAAGEAFALALKDDGTVWAWGNNAYGQLGDGTVRDRSTPTAVPKLPKIAALAAGHSHALAIDEDGALWSWGKNEDGQLGDGTREDRSVPARVPGLGLGLEKTRAAAAGWGHSLALLEDGTLRAWGANLNGVLGNGTQDDSVEPVAVREVANIIAIASGKWHSLALQTGGAIWIWGNNGSGQLGDGGRDKDRLAPALLKNLPAITAIAAGHWHTLARDAEGTIWAWGNNAVGQLGDGTQETRNAPVQTKF
jgi:alpha-tubulin suppressor-like RCC1 family protein